MEAESPEIVGEYEHFVEESRARRSRRSAWPTSGWWWRGAPRLVLGGWAIVEGAVAVAEHLGISQVVIGLTVVAVGTSLPELATSLVAALRKEPDIAVGNVIGSNIFNIVAILGMSAVVAPCR